MRIFYQKKIIGARDIIIEFKKNGDFEFSGCDYGGSPSGDFDDPNDYEYFITVENDSKQILYEKLSEFLKIDDDTLENFILENSKDFAEIMDELDKNIAALSRMKFSNYDGFYEFREFLNQYNIPYKYNVWG